MKTDDRRMPRRHLLRGAGATVAGLALTHGARAAEGEAPVVLRMASSWPTSLPLLHESALDFARTVRELTAGKILVEVHDPSVHGKPAGILDLVSSGDYALGHTTAQYYASKLPAIDFFTAVPFGLTPIELHAWMNEGGGLELLDRQLAPVGVRALLAGNTGVQMGGWFAREIKSVDDLRGLRVRINGFPGRVLARLRCEPIAMPLGQVAAAFADKRIDAADIVGPAIDRAMGVAKFAPFYYLPWHEYDVGLHLFLNRSRIEHLPTGTYEVLRNAAHAAALRSMARAQFQNAHALRELQHEGVQLRSFDAQVLNALRRATEEELAAAMVDKGSAEVIDSWRASAASMRSYASTVEVPALAYR